MPVQKEKLLSIGEAAHYLGVSIDTLRNWDKQGRLIPQKTAAGTRKYPISILETIRQERGISNNISSNETSSTTNEYLLIGEAARFLGVSIDTLRNWETQNKIFPARTSGGQRKYLRSDLEKIRQTNIYLIRKESKPFKAEEFIHSLATIEHEPKIDFNHLTKSTEDEKYQGNYIKTDTNIINPLLAKLFFRRRIYIPVACSGLLISIFMAFLILARVSNFQILGQTMMQKQVALSTTEKINPDVLAVTATSHYLNFSTDLIVEGDLAVGGRINNLILNPIDTGFTVSGGNISEKTLSVTADQVTLDQDVSTTSSPTFAGLTVLSPINAPSASTSTLSLTGTKDQITFDISGVKSTLTWSPTSAQTITLPNATTTMVGTDTTQTLTNKTISGSDNTISNIQSSALSGSFTGITGLGTITTGTWNGTKIGTTYGGTGLTSYTTGDLIYSSASNTLANLAVGTAGQFLGISSGVPTWTSLAASSIAADSINFTELADSMTLDANLAISSSASNYSMNIDSGTLFVDTANNRVGIGTTAPAYTLDVTGTTNLAGATIIAPSSASTALTLRSAPTGTNNIFNVTNSTGSTTFFSVDSLGQLSGSAFKITDQNNAIVGTAIPGGWTLGAYTYTYRRSISVTATSDLSINYEVNVPITDATIANKIYSNTEQVSPYRDFRIAYTTNGGATYTELKRNIVATCGAGSSDCYTSSNITFKFQLQAAIANGNISSANYYIFYSSPNLSSMTQTAADLTYIGNIDEDSHTEATTGWTSGDSAFVLSTSGTPTPQLGSYSLKTVSMVDRMGTFSTGSQTQLSSGAQALYDATSFVTNIGGTNHLYIIGGVNSSGTTLSTIYEATVDGSANIGGYTSTGTSNPTISQATAVAVSAVDGGSGSDTTFDLSLGSSVGGCNGTGLSFNPTYNWTERQPAGANNLYWRSVASDSDGSNLIAGYNAKLYTSSDSGANWVERQPAGAVTKDWFAVASDDDGTNLIAAVAGGRLYTSSDSGANWVERQPAGNADIAWYTVASDSDGSNLIAGVSSGRLYTSSDSGANWVERQPAGNADKNWYSVASDSDGSNLIAAAYNGRLYTSSDSGANWVERQPAGATNKNWRGVASDADGSNLIVTVYGGRLYTSTNSGANWTERQPAGAIDNNWYDVNSDSDGSSLVAGIYGGRLYISRDSGVTWVETQPAGNAVKPWYTMASDADGSNLIVAGELDRLYTGVLEEICTIATATKSTFNFTTINIPVNSTVVTTGTTVPTLKATGSVTIAGTINLNGLGYSGGNKNGDTTGVGPGGGTGSGADWTAGGGGGGFGGSGGASGGGKAGGTTYDTLEPGSGGGASSSNCANGGAGGGGIKISTTDNITVSGVIYASGAVGSDASNTCGAGGGGSGGKVYLQSTGNITLSGSITVNGGNGGSASGSGANGGGGGGGRINLEDVDGTVAGTTSVTGGTGPGSAADGSAGVSAVSAPLPSLFISGGKNGSGTAQTAINKATVNSNGTVNTFSATTQGLPAARFGHTSFSQTVNGTKYIYFLGGNDGSSDSTTVYKATVTTAGDITAAPDSASQRTLPVALSNHATAAVTISGTTYVYVIGGSSSGTNQTAIYRHTIDNTTGDISSGTAWTTETNVLPVALKNLTAQTATIGSVNYLFVFGGRNAAGTDVGTVYRSIISNSDGSLGELSAVGQAQLSDASPNTTRSSHSTASVTISSIPYFYTIGGLIGSTAQSSVYKSTLTSSMTNFYIYKQISSTGIDMSNKNDITFGYYTNNATTNLEQVAFSESASPDPTTDTGWQTATFPTSTPSTSAWNTVDWDITGIGTTSRDSVKWLRLKINTAQSTEIISYIDNIQFKTTSTAGSDTSTAQNAAVLGAANLTVNAQGTGLVRINYSDSGNSNSIGLAGSGGFKVYDGTQDCSDGSNSVSCPLFAVDSAGNISAVGTTGLTLSGNGAGITFSGTGNHDITASAGTLRLGAFTLTGNLTGSGSPTLSSMGAINGLTLAAASDGFTIAGGTTPRTLTVTGSSVTLNQSLSTSSSPTFAGLASPTLTGGSGVGSSLTLQSTTGIGTTDFINFKVGSNGLTEAMRIIDSGNVGIGTTNPTSALSVGSTSQFQVDTNGAIVASTGITTSGGYTQSGTTANTFTGTSTFSNATYSALFTGGNVGIGTTAPASPLSVNGGISAGTYSATAAPANTFIINTGVGIGTTAPARSLETTGSIRMGPLITGGGTAVAMYRDANGDLADSTSSILYKTDVTQYENVLDKVMQLTAVNFKWNELTPTPGASDFGMIAESVNTIMPDLVIYDPDGVTPHGLKYDKMGFIALKAIQELNNKLSSFNLSLDEKGNIVIPKAKIALLDLSDDASLASDQNYFDVAAKFDNIDLRTKDTETRVLGLETKVSSHSAQIADTKTELDSLKAELASLSAQIASNSSVTESTSSATDSASPNTKYDIPNTELGLTPPEILLATGSAQLISLSVTSEATISGQLAAYQATISDTFKSLGDTFLGNTTVAGDFSVDGTLSLSADSVNSIGTLYLQSSPLADALDIMNGQFIFNKDGTLTVAGSVVASQFAVKPNTSAGTGTILANQVDAVIENSYVDENSVILITPHRSLSQTIGVAYRVKGAFLIQLNHTETTDIIFDYIILGVKP